MDQLILGNSTTESELISADVLKSLSDLELALIGGGIGDTILK